MNIGESQIGPQTIQKVTPDVVSSQGLSQLYEKMTTVAAFKHVLDSQLEKIAGSTGTDFSSRIKNAQTVVQKIAQKRLQGRSYDIEDINDAYGGRFIVDDKKDIPKVLSLVRNMADKNDFKINDDERVKTGTYNAHHIDFETSDGMKGEVQIMTPQQALESVANHGLRSVHGEKPSDNVEILRNKQAELAKKIGNSQAKQKVDIIQKVAKANNNQPVDPRLVAGILTK